MAKFNNGITNLEELEVMLNKKAKEALEISKEVALKKLLSLIDESIYQKDEGWYKRTGDLKDPSNWNARVVKGLRGYTLEIFLEPNHFTHNETLMQHTNAIGNDIEIEELARLINDPSGLGLSTNLSSWGIQHEPFWNEFQEWFSTEFPNIFHKTLQDLLK